MRWLVFTLLLLAQGCASGPAWVQRLPQTPELGYLQAAAAHRGAVLTYLDLLENGQIKSRQKAESIKAHLDKTQTFLETVGVELAQNDQNPAIRDTLMGRIDLSMDVINALLGSYVVGEAQ